MKQYDLLRGCTTSVDKLTAWLTHYIFYYIFPRLPGFFWLFGWNLHTKKSHTSLRFVFTSFTGIYLYGICLSAKCRQKNSSVPQTWPQGFSWKVDLSDPTSMIEQEVNEKEKCQIISLVNRNLNSALKQRCREAQNGVRLSLTLTCCCFLQKLTAMQRQLKPKQWEMWWKQWITLSN